MQQTLAFERTGTRVRASIARFAFRAASRDRGNRPTGRTMANTESTLN